MLSDLRFRLRALFRRHTMEQELHDELRFHIERETEKYVAAGMPREEAERRARVAFGGVERIKDDTRDARGIALIDSVLQDLRYAWRGLRTKPGFTAAVVLTLGLGVGANTAMFGIVDRLLFRAPTYLRSPDRVHRIYLEWTSSDGGRRAERTLEYTRFANFTDWTTSFDRTAVVGYRQMAVGVGDEARELRVAIASASFFDFFDAPPVRGRYYTMAEDRPPVGAPVAVLGYGYWQTRFAGRADALGSTLQIDRTIYTIVGVAPRDFVGITEGSAPALFIPATAYAGSRNSVYYQNYHWGWLEMFARRKAGVSLEAAHADLTNAYQRSWEHELTQDKIAPQSVAHPRAFAGPVQLARGPEASQDSRIVTWVMGVAAIVLLIACANVANLLLARAVRRRREIALRLALGVTRPRLLQQLLLEGMLVAALGGIAGLAFAQWGGSTLRALFLRREDVGAVVTDNRTLLFSVAITLGVAFITGLAPALHALRDDVAGALKAGEREGTYRRSRLRTTLLVFQGALSVVLLVGAGLFVRSLQNVRALRLGYDVAPLILIEGNMRGVRLPAAEQNALNDRLLAATAEIPGITSVTHTVSVPFWTNEGRGAPHVSGVDSTHKLGHFLLQAGSPSYFETVGTRVLRGRTFTDADRGGAQKVALISEGMARVLWPGKDALGQQFRIGDDTSSFITVIGIVEDMRGRMLQDEREFWYYIPIAQYRFDSGEAWSPDMFARVNGRASDYVEVLRRRLQREMPGASYVTVRPLRELVAPRQRSWEFGATMFVAFGMLALVLAAIGLYSVIAYAVAQRTHELGVRIALGASVGDVLRMIVRQGLAFAIAGIAIGSLVSLWAGKWIEPLLFSESPRDPLVYGAVGTVLLVVAIVATLRPAIRATRVDPTVALRSE
jgi:predicted permease